MSASKIVLRLVSISFTVLLFLVAVYGLYELGISSYNYGYRIFAEPPVSSGEGSDKLVQVKDSMSDFKIAKLLEEKGLVRDHLLFVLQLKISGYSGKIKTGNYTLNTSMTAETMMRIMSQEDLTDTEQEESE